ncbi:hypothetical protein [Burkholderia sp. L27(2015)]|uniref:hypothetical protein n=1 Tax=Burkholderia sp. L27(2015) TaxID=1641858 RepID=UPI00131D9A53|nr:hypothetical protein [Burkholderia sp. L27(2015)]
MNIPETDTVQIAASTPTRRNGAVFIESETLETLLGQQEEDGKVRSGPGHAVEGALRVFHALNIPALLLLSRGLDNIGAACGCYERDTFSTRPAALHGLEIISFCAPDLIHANTAHADNEQVNHEQYAPADYDLVPDALRELVRHMCTGRRIIAADSWFITDCPDYLACAAISGCATILLRSRHAGRKRGSPGVTPRAPDFVARDLSQAALRIAFERHETIAALRTLHAMQACRPPPLPPALEHNIAA